MKLVLMPLLIAGMFVSFTAALMAMLFFTGVVESPQELEDVLQGRRDPTRLSEEFVDPEDKLGQLAGLMEEYRTLYQSRLESVQAVRDSLDAVEAQLISRGEILRAEEQRLALLADSTHAANALQGLEKLAPSYGKLKPDAAAEILQEGTLSDTTVAGLMLRLQPQQMAKIMGRMEAQYAARITKIIQEIQ
ncbi:hypothetical protein ACFL6X_08630 [Candidatus Latescibacterota bacterium]